MTTRSLTNFLPVKNESEYMPALERGIRPQPAIVDKRTAPSPRVKPPEVPKHLQKITFQPSVNPIRHHADLLTKSFENKPKNKKRAELWSSRIHDLRKNGHSRNEVDIFLGKAFARLENKSKKSKKEAERDELTKLYSRVGFKKRFKETLSRADRTGEQFSIAVADLDKFKSINDDYGHPCGDAVLKQTARHLRRSGRGHDIWGRHGGEEFIGIVSGTNIQQAAGAIERQRINLPKTVTAGLAHEGKFTIHRTITMSVGIATYDQHAYEKKFGTRQEQINRILIDKKKDITIMSDKNRTKTLKKAEKKRRKNILHYLTDKADQALYKAKDSGRDKAFAATEDIHGNSLFVDARTLSSPTVVYDRMSA